MYGIQKKVLDNKLPDAYIKSNDGLICIDSKFPLDNYRKRIEEADEKEKEKYKKKYLDDVKVHLKKVAKDYVCPDKGSAEFAFVYIPSEAFCSFLRREGCVLLEEYARNSVEVVSPLTVSFQISLKRKNIFTMKLSEDAQTVKNEIYNLSRDFKEINDSWRIFYQTHLLNLLKKADYIDSKYRLLFMNFKRISLNFFGE